MSVIPGVTLLASAVAGVSQHFEAKKAARKAERKQEHANRVESVSAQVANARSRRQAIAQARIAQAQNMAATSGQVQSSSASSGTNAALASQLGANIGSQQQSIASQQAAFDFRQGAQRALDRGQQRVGAWNAVGDTTKFVADSFT